MNPLFIEGSVADAVKKRYSCRTYDGRYLDAAAREAISLWMKDIGPAPFGSSIRFALVAAADDDARALRGLGTYGFIKKPAGFIVGAMKDSPMNLEDFGFLMEWLILAAASRGLGTCWLGGTFTRSSFAERIGCADDEIIPAVVSIGYPADAMRMFERLARWKVDADNRLSWDALFSEGEIGTPLSRKAAGAYTNPLDMVRLAPSAVNYQPWRIVREKGAEAYRFHLARTRDFDEKSFMVKADLQRIDMGIAMAHFDLATREAGMEGRWEKGQGIQASAGSVSHVATWRNGR